MDVIVIALIDSIMHTYSIAPCKHTSPSLRRHMTKFMQIPVQSASNREHHRDRAREFFEREKYSHRS